MFAKDCRGGPLRLPRRGIAYALVAVTVLATAGASAYQTSRAGQLAAATAPASDTSPGRPRVPAALRAADQAPLAQQARTAAAARAKKQQAAADAARVAAARRPAPVPATTSYQVSPGVMRLLSRGLRLPVSSALLTGLRPATPAGTLQTELAAGLALPDALPSGVKAPAFTGTTLRIDPASDTLTVTASADGAALSLRITHASTTSLGSGGDLSGRLSVPVTMRGTTVKLSGPLGYAKGRVSASLAGLLAAPMVLQPGVAELAANARMALSDAGLRVAGTASLGPDGHRVTAAVSGRVASADRWTLNVGDARAPAPGPLPGLALGTAMSGTVTVDHAGVSYDVHARTARTWRPLAGMSMRSADVRYGNSVPSDGLLAAPGASRGTPWVTVTGDVALAAGTAGTMSGTGAVAANLASGVVAVTGRQGPAVTFTAAPHTVLRDSRFGGRLTMSAANLSGRIAGTGQIAVSPAGGKASTSTASLSLTAGALVASFPIDRSALGMGAPGTLNTGYWAATATPAVAAPGGGTRNLPAGLSATAPHSAALQRPSTTSATTASGETALTESAGTTSYTLSPAAYTFLTQRLGVPLGSSPTISGTLSGTTLTLMVGAPGPLPLTLPAGVPAPTFGPTTITVDEAAGTLTLDAGATAGVSAALHVTIAHAQNTSLSGGTDLTATLTLGNVPFVAGSTVSLTGSLSYTGGTLGASLTGSLDRALVLASGAVTLQPGTSLSIATGTGLSLHGAAVLGSGQSAYPLQIDGSLTDLRNWSISVTSPSGQPWQPVPGVTLFPSFNAALTDEAGEIGFDLSSTGSATWQPASDATLAVTGFEVANRPPAAGESCPDLARGDVWLRLNGSFGYHPADLTLDAAACVNLTSKAFQVSTEATGTLLPDWAGIKVTRAKLSATGNVATSAFAVTATADAEITAPRSGGRVAGSAVASFAGGGILVGVQVPDLSPLDPSLTGGGAVYVSTRGIYPFNPADYGMSAQAYPATIGLQPGINVALSYTVSTLPSDIGSAITKAGGRIPAGSSLLAVAQLSASGLSLTVDVNFGTKAGGAQIINTGGTAVYLDDLSIGFSAGSRTSIQISGAGYLKLPAMWKGGAASEVGVFLTANVNATTVSVNFGLSLNDWHDNAFGVPGMQVDSLAASAGVTAYGDVTMSFWADGVHLPDGWGAAIGLAPGARVTMDASFDPASPVLNFSLQPGSSGVALTPLSVAYAPQLATGQPLTTDQQNVVNSLQINRASLFLAPLGGHTPSGLDIKPGIAVAFKGTVAGVSVDVQGAVDVAGPSLAVDAYVGAYRLGPVTMGGTHLIINASPTLLELKFTGSFAYSDNFIFTASVGLHLASTAYGASARFTVYAGMPSYLTISADLQGTVYGDGAGASISASAMAGFVVNGSRFGSIRMTLNLPGGVSFLDLDDISTIVWYLRNAGASVPQMVADLEKVGYSDFDVLNALSSAGIFGQSVLDLLFSSNYYYIWSDTSAGQSLVFDVPDSSGRVYTKLLNLIGAKDRQAWRFVEAPAYPGWYEIVNRASGQCLTTTNYSGGNGALLIQFPCHGVAAQLWYTGGSPSVGPKFTFFNRQALLDGYWRVADVQSGYPWDGGAMEIWTNSNTWNQKFRLTQAVA